MHQPIPLHHHHIPPALLFTLALGAAIVPVLLDAREQISRRAPGEEAASGGPGEAGDRFRRRAQRTRRPLVDPHLPSFAPRAGTGGRVRVERGHGKVRAVPAPRDTGFAGVFGRREREEGPGLLGCRGFTERAVELGLFRAPADVYLFICEVVPQDSAPFGGSLTQGRKGKRTFAEFLGA
jgi:hypothetical protein